MIRSKRMPLVVLLIYLFQSLVSSVFAGLFCFLYTDINILVQNASIYIEGLTLRKELFVEDKRIVSDFLARNEDAIKEVQIKYGQYCFRIANNILSNQQDAEECVNDAWNVLWNTIPPTVPVSLKAYLGKVIRNQALTRYRSAHTQKRNDDMDIIWDEMDECIPSNSNADENANYKLLSGFINDWLRSLTKSDRIMFLRRYYICESLQEISKEFGVNENRIAQKLHKLRKNLKDYLDKKGYEL